MPDHVLRAWLLYNELEHFTSRLWHEFDQEFTRLAIIEYQSPEPPDPQHWDEEIPF